MRFERAILFLFLTSFVVALCNNGSEYRDSKLVKIAQGPVRGYRDPKGLFVFYNIPYATAPTGPHKFKAPLPPPTWLEPLEAVDRGIVCPQSAVTVDPYMVEQEDCLVANVFVPDTEEKNLPVVVYIHGGTLKTGFGNMLRPKHVVSSKNIIVVTVNYRLAVTGFLCLGTQDVPGNAALKDIVAALHWVKKNIAAFAGNPNDVTLAAISSAASITDLLTLSPATAGLFNKAIIDSSVSLKSYTVVRDPIKNARILATYLGFNDTHDMHALENFYKSAPLKTLTKDAAYYFFLTKNSALLFAPCIERGTEGKETKILTDTPFNILKTGTYRHVPMLYGFANMEGILFTIFLNKLLKKDMNESFLDFLPISLQFNNKKEKENVAKAVKKLYFGDKPVSDETILEYTDFFGDMFFKMPLFKTIQMRLAVGQDKIHLFQYSFVDDDVSFVPYTNTRGATHNDITWAVLDDATNEDDISNDYKKMKSIMREIWANFVKTSSPAPPGSSLPAWPPVGPGLTPFMNLTQSPRLVWEWDQTWHERKHFWDSVFELYYHQGPSSLPETTTREKLNEMAQDYLRPVWVTGTLTRERQNTTSQEELTRNEKVPPTKCRHTP